MSPSPLAAVFRARGCLGKWVLESGCMLPDVGIRSAFSLLVAAGISTAVSTVQSLSLFSCICTLALHRFSGIALMRSAERFMQRHCTHSSQPRQKIRTKTKSRFKGITLFHYHNHSRLEYPRGTLSKFITTYHTGRSLRRSMRGSLPSLSRSLSLSLPPTPARSLCLSPSSRLKETWDCRRHEWPA